MPLKKKVFWYCFINFSFIFLLFCKKEIRKVLLYMPQTVNLANPAQYYLRNARASDDLFGLWQPVVESGLATDSCWWLWNRKDGKKHPRSEPSHLNEEKTSKFDRATNFTKQRFEPLTFCSTLNSITGLRFICIVQTNLKTT